MAGNDKATRQASTAQQEEVPKYKLTEPAYIDDRLLEAGQVIGYKGVPGYHMEPVNEAAEVMKELHPGRKIDPILEMTDITANPGAASALAETVAAAMVKAMAQARAA